MTLIDYTMKLITLNGKILRKDPKYYMQDVFEFPDYDGSYEKLELAICINNIIILLRK